MAGPRRDKEEAWRRLQVILDALELDVWRTQKTRSSGLREKCKRDLAHAVENLKRSGRLDAKQIYAIQHLARALWALVVEEFCI